MKRIIGRKLRSSSVALTFGVLSAVSLMAEMGSESGDAKFWFSFGPSVRGGMEMKASGSTYANSVIRGEIGVPSIYGNRAYDDGYVNRASSEGGGLLPNSTWNWGYDTAGQYDAAAGTLSYTRQGLPRYSAYDGGGGAKDTILGGGFKLDMGLPLIEKEKWGVDLVFGFEGNWSEGSIHNSASYVTVNDTYNVAGIAGFPAAGHRGTYNGPFDPTSTPPYTVISNLPADRQEVPFVPAAGVQSSVNLDMDQGLYTIYLGPQIQYLPTKKLNLFVRPTISVNIMDVSVSRSESFMYGDGTGLRRWSDSNSDLSCYPGLGAMGGINYEFGGGWFAGAYGGYEWVVKTADMKVGPTQIRMNASGWVAGLSIGKKF